MVFFSELLRSFLIKSEHDELLVSYNSIDFYIFSGRENYSTLKRIIYYPFIIGFFFSVFFCYMTIEFLWHTQFSLLGLLVGLILLYTLWLFIKSQITAFLLGKNVSIIKLEPTKNNALILMLEIFVLISGAKFSAEIIAFLIASPLQIEIRTHSVGEILGELAVFVGTLIVCLWFKLKKQNA